MALDIFIVYKRIFMQKNGYLGIDVSKGYADFILLDGRSQQIEKSFELIDTIQGRKDLKQLINRWQEQGLEQLYCGVESTGGYENNWYSFLKGFQSAGERIYVTRLNAKVVKSVGEASLTRTITDAVSAENIAKYLVKYPEKVNYGLSKPESNEQFKSGRQFVTGLQMWIKQKVQLSNQLEKLLYQNLSEMLVYCRHGIPSWMLQILSKYPSAEQVKKAGVSGLSKIKGISKEKAAAILKKISESDQLTNKTLQSLISITAKEILHKEGLVDSNKKYLNNIYKDDPSVKLLNDVKGIGLDSAVSIILEIEDVTRFKDAKKLTAYFGTHPTFKKSGDGTWGNHMSKQGRGHIRSVLYMTTLSAIRYNPMFKQLYARFRAKGMNHKQAAGVVMNKMLRVIYGILTSGKPFNPDIEKKHRENATQKQQTKEQESKKQTQSIEEQKKRFQTYVTTAPISGRNVKTRKKRLASQTSKEVNTGSPTADANI
jgi:transposase